MTATSRRLGPFLRPALTEGCGSNITYPELLTFYRSRIGTGYREVFLFYHPDLIPNAGVITYIVTAEGLRFESIVPPNFANLVRGYIDLPDLAPFTREGIRFIDRYKLEFSLLTVYRILQRRISCGNLKLSYALGTTYYQYEERLSRYQKYATLEQWRYVRYNTDVIGQLLGLTTIRLQAIYDSIRATLPLEIPPVAREVRTILEYSNTISALARKHIAIINNFPPNSFERAPNKMVAAEAEAKKIVNPR